MKAELYHPGFSDKKSSPWPVQGGEQCKQLDENDRLKNKLWDQVHTPEIISESTQGPFLGGDGNLKSVLAFQSQVAFFR